MDSPSSFDMSIDLSPSLQSPYNAFGNTGDLTFDTLSPGSCTSIENMAELLEELEDPLHTASPAFSKPAAYPTTSSSSRRLFTKPVAPDDRTDSEDEVQVIADNIYNTKSKNLHNSSKDVAGHSLKQQKKRPSPLPYSSYKKKVEKKSYMSDDTDGSSDEDAADAENYGTLSHFITPIKRLNFKPSSATQTPTSASTKRLTPLSRASTALTPSSASSYNSSYQPTTKSSTSSYSSSTSGVKYQTMDEYFKEQLTKMRSQALPSSKLPDSRPYSAYSAPKAPKSSSTAVYSSHLSNSKKSTPSLDSITSSQSFRPKPAAVTRPLKTYEKPYDFSKKKPTSPILTSSARKTPSLMPQTTKVLTAYTPNVKSMALTSTSSSISSLGNTSNSSIDLEPVKQINTAPKLPARGELFPMPKSLFQVFRLPTLSRNIEFLKNINLPNVQVNGKWTSIKDFVAEIVVIMLEDEDDLFDSSKSKPNSDKTDAQRKKDVIARVIDMVSTGAKLDQQCVLAGLYYLHKAVQNGGMILRKENIAARLCCSIMLACKFHADYYLGNDAWSKYLNVVAFDRLINPPTAKSDKLQQIPSSQDLDAKILSRTEILMLKMLDYNLCVSYQELEGFIETCGRILENAENKPCRT